MRVRQSDSVSVSCVSPGRVDEVVRAFKEKTGFTEATLPLNPVILLPGLGASGLQAALDKVRKMAHFLPL